MMGRRPREAARWREVLERPVGEASGLWRRWGWEWRMRVTRSGSEAWIARRRRREGSILCLSVLSAYLRHDENVWGYTSREHIFNSILLQTSSS